MVPYCQPCGEQAKHEERLRARLVLDVVLDGVRDEVLILEEHLRAQRSSVSLHAHYRLTIVIVSSYFQVKDIHKGFCLLSTSVMDCLLGEIAGCCVTPPKTASKAEMPRWGRNCTWGRMRAVRMPP